MKKLPRIKRYQKKYNFSYSFGTYPTLELLRYRKESVLNIFFKEKGLETEGGKEVLEFCKKEGIHYEVNDKLIDRISFKENTYVIGVFEKYVSELEDDKNHVVLVNPVDMGNMGTIIRTMVGFGFKNLGIIEPSVDIFDPKVVRSTMGAFFKINFKHYSNIHDYMSEFSTYNYYPFMLDGKSNILEVEFNEPFSIIQGNEGEGLGEEYANIGKSVYIPHSKDIDSLNLSVATSIGLWEYARKK
ncbi:MAG: TrmH family RNA methyltransferase [Candidatus Dojkabacteria bacterium]|jgi:TrmH family RNA methyltransferase|nr:TrmH family RNA methyltransferase [Candidatus Dojkabacteria bacterium]NLB12213.1 TrmH family RNA methyltransferase [Candidatus Dojkabacteria bacterium]HOR52799.1 TrmH family RNA methyltransferase [Candidatus Pacearchaeota archaeon]